MLQCIKGSGHNLNETSAQISPCALLNEYRMLAHTLAMTIFFIYDVLLARTQHLHKFNFRLMITILWHFVRRILFSNHRLGLS